MLLVIVGEAVLRRSWQTVEYAVAVAVMFAGVVVLLEEPLLRSQFAPPIRNIALRYPAGCRDARRPLNEPASVSASRDGRA